MIVSRQDDPTFAHPPPRESHELARRTHPKNSIQPCSLTKNFIRKVFSWKNNGRFPGQSSEPNGSILPQDHSLRGLYGAAHFAESAASLFAQLYKRFGFQADNVRRAGDGGRVRSGASRTGGAARSGACWTQRTSRLVKPGWFIGTVD